MVTLPHFIVIVNTSAMFKYFLTYSAVKTEIEKEPIGWDDFSVSLKRNDKSHGISAEFSEMSLKFWCCTSIDILHSAYNADVDSIVTFSVENDGIEEYSGQVDFGEYKDGFDQYDYIEIKVAEIGIQATFNNRIEQKVDIDSLVAFDGAVLPVYANLNKEIILPGKDIKSTSRSENKELYSGEIGSLTWYYPATGNHPLVTRAFRVDLAFPDSIFEELNDYFGATDSVVIKPSGSYAEASPIFIKNTDDPTIIESSFHVTFKFKGSVVVGDALAVDPGHVFDGKLYLQKGIDRTVVFQSNYTSRTPNEIFFNCEYTIDIANIDKLYFCIELQHSNYLGSVGGIDYPIFLKMDAGNNFEISALSKVKETTARLSFVHETLSRLTEIITNGGVKVKSDYFGRTDSNVNPVPVNGYGSFKALSTGLRVRNAVMSDGSTPPFSLSFSDIIKGLTPIDNIGYGFVKESGVLSLRVEKWDYFYNSSVIFTINNPSKMVVSLDPVNVISRFKIGYKKYSTGDTNGIDGFHSEREYRTRVKLVETLLEQLSDFVTDSYAIEYTRRLTLQKDTKDWEYDDDVFLFVLKRAYRSYVAHPEMNINVYLIDFGVTDSGETIISPATVYNARISPARIARNWLNKIFSFKKSGSENLNYTAGTGNTPATFNPVDTPSFSGMAQPGPYTDTFTYHGSDDAIMSENGSFQSGSVILKPETLTISEYPLTRDEYEVIKNNPYGIISVDGEACFLKSLTYKFKTGMASFTLIPKYT